LGYSPHGVVEALDEGKRELIAKYGRSVFPIYAEIKARITLNPGKEGSKQKEEDVVKDIGTAWSVRSDGYLLTAYHVVNTKKVKTDYEAEIKKKYDALPISENYTIEFSADYYVIDSKDRKFPITVVAKDASEDVDLALLHMDKKWGLSFPSLPLGDFKKHPYGSVISIGTPLGMKHMVVDGTLATDSLQDCSNVSGKYLITMSAINPGNSGGPTILRETGEVLSLVTSIIIRQYGHTFISCGIPASTIQKFLNTHLPPRRQ
jgi:S1-C subfamily serine protease